MSDLLIWLRSLATHAFDHAWAWRMLVAASIGILGIWLARWVARALDRLMLRLQVEQILRSFLRNVSYAIAVIVALIAALDYAGVPTTSLLAVVGAAGLAIGLALKDSLANIASGVMLIMLRPFHTGDSVQIAGLEGIVDSVRIFQTTLHTGDNRVIILPNSQITAAPIINFTTRGERRLDLNIGIGYSDDLAAARTSLIAAANGNRRVKSEPAPEVLLLELGDTRVSLQLRAWVPAGEVAFARSELLETIHGSFAGQGIRIPVLQREVHVHHHGTAMTVEEGVQATTPRA
ncbi:mechanosensitive ion channel family protein [Arenimonas oryziterrae]|uniref:Small-conductance mechanosensitive channel n=1 Tax=Arenimonas oryziterrae DSM 21050 = YC6267 TaxID=1121015 RepID=A0A091AUL9_9GAMM|nr:mechanosensitive ion channel domain-containing protein [Arenimonas oryziterrae]KFN42927.1 hypothetical protein N789_12440 [Arenimonas oryziterrae DSM 21050 = YC6267]